MRATSYKGALFVFLFLIGIVGIYVFLLYPLGAPREDEIIWLSDMNEAKSKAQNEYKPLLIYFYMVFDDTCNRMMSETFSNTTLMNRLSENFILVKLNSNSNQYWTSYYDVRIVPETIFASPEGKTLRSVSGFKDSRTFYDEALKALEKWKKK